MPPGDWLRWACLLLLAGPTLPCPQGCDCFIREVFCSDEGLAAVPLDIPPHATDIIFVETSFTVVGSRAFSGSPTLPRLSFLPCCPSRQGHIVTPIIQQLPRYSVGLRGMGLSEPTSQLRTGTELSSREETAPHW